MSAILSPNGQFRYRLEREVTPLGGHVIGYFGINPSTADATEDDATVRKWIGFTKVMGGSRFIVGNVCAHRATEVGDLANIDLQAVDFELNRTHILQIIADADVLVPCWGDRKKAPKWLQAEFDVVLGLLRSSGKPVQHFGLTKGGDPRHPLMLGYDTPMVLLEAT